MLFCISFLLYCNTLGHKYAQDDAIVIYDNMYTQQGLEGIPGLLTKDTFFGFFKVEGKDKLVSGGRYRPLTPVMFAVEWALFGNNPAIGHFINVLLFAFLVLLIYSLSQLLFASYLSAQITLFSFAAALLFAAHPIHTEVVANIKGRDEIMSLLGALSACYFILKYRNHSKVSYLAGAAICFFLGLLSKENTITFLAVIPLALVLFPLKNKASVPMKAMLAVLASTLAFLVIRTQILGFDFGASSSELMNNPYLKWDGNKYIAFTASERFGTIAYSLLLYLKLLVLPHPLIHDYYPRALEIQSLSDILPLLSVLLHVILAGLAFYFFKSKRVLSFSILYYFITLSIVSNIVFPIGTNMSERFLFMPSLGFCWIIALLIIWLAQRNKTLTWPILGVLFLAYSYKTVTRNTVWYDDFTLFTTDVKQGTRSAKLLNAAGGALSTEANKKKDSPEKTQMLEQAVEYLTKAIGIHPSYKSAYMLRANSQYWLGNFEEAIKDYERVLQIDPGHETAMDNLPIAMRDAGRYYGEQKQDYKKAQRYLQQAYSLNPEDTETLRLLGISSGLLGNHEKAIEYFKKVVENNPKIAQSYVNVGIAYRNAGDLEQAQIWFEKAAAIDPESVKQFSN